MTKVGSELLFLDRTTTGATKSFNPYQGKVGFQAYGDVSESTGSATILIEGSMDGSNWVTQDTISLTLGTTKVQGFKIVDAAFKFMRANVSAITGTGAKVTVYCGG